MFSCHWISICRASWSNYWLSSDPTGVTRNLHLYPLRPSESRKYCFWWNVCANKTLSASTSGVFCAANGLFFQPKNVYASCEFTFAYPVRHKNIHQLAIKHINQSLVHGHSMLFRETGLVRPWSSKSAVLSSAPKSRAVILYASCVRRAYFFLVTRVFALSLPFSLHGSYVKRYRRRTQLLLWWPLYAFQKVIVLLPCS